MTRTHRRRRTGFTVIDLLVAGVVLVIAVVLIGLVLPQLGPSTPTHPMMRSGTQLRMIHQGMITYAQSNKKGGRDGFFPGLDASGNVIPDGPLTDYSGDGTQPGARLWILLEGGFITPEYLIAPRDAAKVEAGFDRSAGHHQPVTAANHSYALLAITAPSRRSPQRPGTSAASAATHPLAYGRNREWKETLNSAAIVLGDRAIGTGPADLSSIWTDSGSGTWRGVVVRNDNSTSMEITTSFDQTKYGNQPANDGDELFEDQTGGDDAFLVHDDATTAYSRN